MGSLHSRVYDDTLHMTGVQQQEHIRNGEREKKDEEEQKRKLVEIESSRGNEGPGEDQRLPSHMTTGTRAAARHSPRFPSS